MSHEIRETLPHLIGSNPTHMQKVAAQRLTASLLKISQVTGAANVGLSAIAPASGPRGPVYYAVIDMEAIAPPLVEPRADRPRKPRRKVRTAKYLIFRRTRDV